MGGRSTLLHPSQSLVLLLLLQEVGWLALLESPVREELFHFLGDWQCEDLIGCQETAEGFPA